MLFFRRRLRLLVAIWLVLQGTAASAFVPMDCCAAHRTAGRDQQHRHGEGAARDCPMRGPDGRPCPMHQEQHAHHLPASDRPDADCAMGAACREPIAALMTLLWSPGVPGEAPAVSRWLPQAPALLPAHERAIGLRSTPDVPPPRV